jgi:hydrogenase 3 maturation protease
VSPALQSILSAHLDPSDGGPLAIVTVGNDLRGDDAAGPHIAARLAGNCRTGCRVLHAGEHPENVLDDLIAMRPARVVILDAADFRGQPGELRVIPRDAIPQTTMSTHLFPLAAIAAVIAADTGAQITFLGVQVVDTRLGSPLSPAVRTTVDRVVAWLSR